VDAYVKKNLALAGTVVAYDDVVDDCFDKVKNDLIQIVVQNPADGGRAFDLLMIAKYFERIGDHAVNIAQWVRFSMTGNKES
jgi:phosphate transport system protein